MKADTTLPLYAPYAIPSICSSLVHATAFVADVVIVVVVATTDVVASSGRLVMTCKHVLP